MILLEEFAMPILGGNTYLKIRTISFQIMKAGLYITFIFPGIFFLNPVHTRASTNSSDSKIPVHVQVLSTLGLLACFRER